MQGAHCYVSKKWKKLQNKPFLAEKNMSQGSAFGTQSQQPPALHGVCRGNSSPLCSRQNQWWQSLCPCPSDWVLGKSLFVRLTKCNTYATPDFVKTDMVCYKRLLYMVGFLRPPATTSGWTTFPTGYCNSEIQDGVQDGRHIFKSPYYHQFLLYFHV